MPSLYDPARCCKLSTYNDGRRAASDGSRMLQRYISSMHVYTYGTLMFPEVWRAVVGREFATVEAVAAGFAIFRVRNAVYPGIRASGDEDFVRGIVYLDVDAASLDRLDAFEDNFYERQSLWIECGDGQRRQANAYVVPAHNRAVLTDEPWDRHQFVANGGLDDFIRRFAGFGRVAKKK